SAQEIYYNAYYRPTNYRFADVLRSIDTMKKHGRFVSINYFILPGFTDSEPEYQALCQLIARHKPDFIQLRNLNIDPEKYLTVIGAEQLAVTDGIRHWLGRLQKRFPKLHFGYFNPQVIDGKLWSKGRKDG
ncbi:MAG: radical SAM protein, partial [Desulfobacterales bacterium]